MKAVFFHDVRLKKNDNIYYTSGGLTNNYLQKYLKFFSDITLCVREEIIEKQDIKKLSKVSGKNINVDSMKRIRIFSLFFGKDRKKIKENIEKNDFAIIRLPSFIGIAACREINKSQKSYLIEMVACPFDAFWNHGNIAGKIVAPIMYLLNKHYIKKAQNVIYVSNTFLQKRYPNNHNNIGCSDVNINEMPNDVLQQRINKIENKKEKETVKIGLIGSLNVKYKGHELAIKAISNLKDKYNIELHFLGAGNKENWLNTIKKYRVANNVYFDGTLPSGQEVYNWLDKMDIYIIPSLTEGMPRALIEAMSRGCPCIGTKVGGITELLPEEMLIEKNDCKQLQERIEKLLDNKNLLKKCAIQNFDKAKQFNYDKLNNKKNKFYSEVLGEVRN